MKSENKKPKDNIIVMNEKDLKDMSQSELIALVMKLNKEANRKRKPVEPKNKQIR